MICTTVVSLMIILSKPCTKRLLVTHALKQLKASVNTLYTIALIPTVKWEAVQDSNLNSHTLTRKVQLLPDLMLTASLDSMLEQPLRKRSNLKVYGMLLDHVSFFTYITEVLTVYILISVKQLPVGYEGARNTRCTDRFVKYPYPKVLFSYYRSQYHNKLSDTKVQNHKKAFNLEKEAKIINPHRMELSTTNNVTYRGKKGYPKDAPKDPQVDQPKPIVQMSSYMASFPNWDNGKKDIFHEKHP